MIHWHWTTSSWDIVLRIDLSQWKLAAPKTGTSEPVTLAVPKPIDHRSLQRFLKVTDQRGHSIDGQIAIGFDSSVTSCVSI